MLTAILLTSLSRQFSAFTEKSFSFLTAQEEIQFLTEKDNEQEETYTAKRYKGTNGYL